MQVSVSFFKRAKSIEETIVNIEKTDCDFLHVDIGDGIFIPTDTKDIVSFVRESSKKLDVHLMCAKPLEYINLYKNLNTEYITFHVEIKEDIQSLIDEIKKAHVKAGLAINPETDITKLEPYLDVIDQILVMSVKPGKGGQKFQEDAISKIKKLNQLRQEHQYSYIISVDGGINDQTIKLLKDTGLDMCVSGSYVCLTDNYQEQINKLR